MNTRHRSGRRTAALLAAVAVTGVTAAGIVAGTASAAGTGTCTENVNVRSEPSKTAPVVGTCEKGQTTRVGDESNGFVKLDEFGGWASSEYVSTGSSSTGSGSSGSSSAPNQAEESESTGPSGSGSLLGGQDQRGTNPERYGTGESGTAESGTGESSTGDTDSETSSPTDS